MPKTHLCKYCGETDPDKFEGTKLRRCLQCVGERPQIKQKTNGRKNPLYQKIINAFYRSKNINIDFDITEDDIINVWNQQNKKCCYTGDNLSLEEISIDRIDSQKGYTKNNIQLTSKNINWAKSNLSSSDFIVMVEKIYNHCCKA